MGAFDWSPGGCCCNVFRAYDFYGTIRPQSGTDFYRVPSMYVHPATALDSSKLPPVDWKIPSANGTQVSVNRTLVPVNQTGERVWSSESRNGSQLIVLYDAVAKLQVAAIFDSAANITLGGCSENHAGRILQSFTDPPGITVPTWEWSQVSNAGVRTSGTLNNGGNFNWYARRYWPHFAATQNIGTPFLNRLVAPYHSTFYLGRLNTATNTIDKTNILAAGNTYRSINSGAMPGWSSFDQTEVGWGGVIAYTQSRDAPQVLHERLFINGSEIEQVQASTDIFGPGHIAYSTGHFIIGRKTTTTTPEGFKLFCYSSGGAVVWSSPECTAMPECFASSDRWLYCRLPGVNAVDLQNVIIPWSGTTREYWLIKRDGSQAVPMGTLIKSGPTIGSWPDEVVSGIHPAWGSFPLFDVVHKSDLIGNSLPADANDFLDLAK